MRGMCFCENCMDNGKVGFFWRKKCPVCNGNPEKYFREKVLPARPPSPPPMGSGVPPLSHFELIDRVKVLEEKVRDLDWVKKVIDAGEK